MGVWGVRGLRRCHSVVGMDRLDCCHRLQQERPLRKSWLPQINMTPQPASPRPKSSQIIFILFILRLLDVYSNSNHLNLVIYDTINGLDFTFELEYELEYVLSPANQTFDTMPHIRAPTFNSTPTGVGSCQTSVIECDLIAVLLAITIATTKRNKNENELKYNTDLFWDIHKHKLHQ